MAPEPWKLSGFARAGDWLVVALAVLLGGGSLVFFFWPGRPALFPMNLSFSAALWWNGFLSLLFFVQHSAMIRRPVRARLATVMPKRFDGAVYAIASGVVLIVVAALYQPTKAPLVWSLQGATRLLAHAAALSALGTLAWGIWSLRSVDFFGVRPIRAHLRRDQTASPVAESAGEPLVVRGPYRWVRHPLYSAIVLLLWARAEMSVDHFQIAVLWTAWICVGTILEERDLIAEFGDRYRAYRAQVPMLVPWRRPLPTHT